ncbi:MAG: hypothetical protein ACR2GY_11465 [Phycisphaerales bacterium]
MPTSITIQRTLHHMHTHATARTIDGDVIVDATGKTLAKWYRGNILFDELSAADFDGVPALIAYPGTLAAGGYDAREPRNWMPAGRDAFEAMCAKVQPLLIDEGKQLWLCPHVRSVISDLPGAVKFLRAWSEQANCPFGLAYSTASLFEPSMLAAFDEHLERQIVHLAACSRIVLIEDVQACVSASGEKLFAIVPAGEGVAPLQLARSLIAEHVPAQVAIVG